MTKLTAGSPALVVAIACGSAAVSGQMLSFTRGQNVAPAYEGWGQGSNGSK